jgi:hypothetical protein
MKRIVITRTCGGQWLYMIYIDDRAVVVGMCSTRAAAEAQATVARMKTMNAE